MPDAASDAAFASQRIPIHTRDTIKWIADKTGEKQYEVITRLATRERIRMEEIDAHPARKPSGEPTPAGPDELNPTPPPPTTPPPAPANQPIPSQTPTPTPEEVNARQAYLEERLRWANRPPGIPSWEEPPLDPYDPRSGNQPPAPEVPNTVLARQLEEFRIKHGLPESLRDRLPAHLRPE